MDSYFVRHTDMWIRDEDLKDTWSNNLIAIHHPGGIKEDLESFRPEDYTDKAERKAVTAFMKLATNGGYVWAETRVDKCAKVGIVKPGTQPGIFKARWQPPPGKHVDRTVAKLKVLALTGVKKVKLKELMSLRACVPIKVTISRWGKCKGRLADFVEGRPPARVWDSLSPDIQEILCSEFLREHDLPSLPHLKRLLMPVGRTLKDVDIYGVTESQKEVFAQVTHSGESDSSEKVRALRDYYSPNSILVFFCDCQDLKTESEITYVPNRLVFEWAEREHSYLDKLLSI